MRIHQPVYAGIQYDKGEETLIIFERTYYEANNCAYIFKLNIVIPCYIGK